MFNNRIILLIAIFIISLLSTVFITQGIPFFWEDCQFIQIREGLNKPALFLQQLKENSFQINYSSRPMATVLLDLQSDICGKNVNPNRFFRAFVYSLLTLVCFIFLKRFTSVAFAFFGALFFIFTPENWLQTVYQDVGLYSHLFLTSAFLLFLNIYKLKNKSFLKPLIFTCIIFLIFLSTGAKHEGRYAVFVLLIFSLIYYPKAIIDNWWFYLVLLFISIPILGLLGFGNVTKIINAKVPLELQSLIHDFITNFKDPLFTLGIFMWGLLVCALLINLTISIRRKSLFSWLRNNLSEGLIFSSVWFIFALVFNFLILKWNFQGSRDFSKTYYSFLWMPFLIFVFTVVYSAYHSLKKNKIFLILVIFAVSVSFLVNLKNLNQIRGGWGGYWVSLGNLKSFVEQRDDNSLVLITPRHFYPETFFYGSNNKLEMTPLYSNLEYIKVRYFLGQHRNIYVASFGELNFAKDSQMALLGAVDNLSGSLYDNLKLFMGKKPQQSIFIYKYTYHKNPNF